MRRSKSFFFTAVGLAVVHAWRWWQRHPNLTNDKQINSFCTTKYLGLQGKAMAANTSIIYSDFTSGFLQNPLSHDLGMIVNENAIRQSLRNLILTNRYERLLDPHIGTNIENLLFQGLDGATIKMVQDLVKETVKNYEPRVNLISVVCLPTSDPNQCIITITYSINQFSSVQQLSIPLTRIR